MLATSAITCNQSISSIVNTALDMTRTTLITLAVTHFLCSLLTI